MSDACPCGGNLAETHLDATEVWNRPRHEYEWCLECGFSWGLKDE